MPNPFVTTSMVWDPDINPEGLAEQWKHTFNLSYGGGPSNGPAETSKDGKTIAPPPVEPHKISLDLFANFGQFVYDDANPEDPIGPRGVSSNHLVPNTDSFMLGWQLGARINFKKDMYLQVAPTLYNYTGEGDNFNVFYSGDPSFLNNAVPPATVVCLYSICQPNSIGPSAIFRCAFSEISHRISMRTTEPQPRVIRIREINAMPIKWASELAE